VAPARATDRSARPDAPDPEHVRQLGLEVIRLNRSGHSMRAALLAGGAEGVESAAYALLVPLVKDGPQRTSDLAAAACVDPSTVSRQVAELVGHGLVERQADPGDGRATLLVATEEGHLAFTALQRRREQAFELLVGDWPAADVEALTTLLHRLNESFVARRDQVLGVSAGAATGEGR
jgi:DNA-binding MarR family transcriptional regulator